MITYCQVFKYVLEADATDDVIAKAKANTMNYKQSDNMSTGRYAETRWDISLTWELVYEDSKHNAVSI